MNVFSEPVHRPVPGTPAQVGAAQVGGRSPAEVGPLRLRPLGRPRPWTSGMKSLPAPHQTAKGMPLPPDLAAQQPQLWGGLRQTHSRLVQLVCLVEAAHPGVRVSAIGEKVCNMEMRVPLRPLQSAAVRVPVTAQQPPAAPMPWATAVHTAPSQPGEADSPETHLRHSRPAHRVSGPLMIGGQQPPQRLSAADPGSHRHVS